MNDIMFSVGIGIMLVTYCLLVHSMIKKPDFGENNYKLRDKLFVLLLCEMIIICIFRL
jgi:hypothetical protein